MARQSITIPASDLAANTASLKRYDLSPWLQIIDGLTPGATSRLLNQVGISTFTNRIFLAFTATSGSGTDSTNGQDLTTTWEQYAGAVTFEQGSNSVTIGGPDASTNQTRDSSERYFFQPSAAQWTALNTFFFTNLDASADLTIILDDGVTFAPSFANPIGPGQRWFASSPIPDITVPEASGAPAPTYAVVGMLPAGINFDTTTRVISGTPEDVGSGTIIIRASNSEGSADWRLAYSIETVASEGTGVGLILDTTGSGSHDTNLSARVMQCIATIGVPRSGQRLEPVAGTLEALLTYQENAIEVRTGYGIRMQWNGETVWTGKARAPKVVTRGQRRLIQITAVGPIDDLVGVKLASNVVVAADDTVMTLLARIVAAAGLAVGTIVTDIDTRVGQGAAPNRIGSAGDDILPVLATLTRNTDTALRETAEGRMEIVERALTLASGLAFNREAISGVPQLVSQNRAYNVERPENMLLANTVTVGTDTVSDADSIAREGTLVYPDALDFVHADEDDHVAREIINLYGDRYRVARISGLISLWGEQSGLTDEQILERLRYGSEYQMRFYDEDETDPISGEALHTRYEALHGRRLRITTSIRERGGLLDHAFSVRTVINKHVAYSTVLPALSEDGARTITGHVVEYKLPSETMWQRGPIRTTGSGLRDGEVELPTENLYDMRVVARSASQDEQVGLQRCIMAVNLEVFQNQISATDRRGRYGVLHRLHSSVPQAIRDIFTATSEEQIANSQEYLAQRNYTGSETVIPIVLTSDADWNFDRYVVITVLAQQVPFTGSQYGDTTPVAANIPSYFRREFRVKPIIAGHVTYWSPWLNGEQLREYKHN